MCTRDTKTRTPKRERGKSNLKKQPCESGGTPHVLSGGSILLPRLYGFITIHVSLFTPTVPTQKSKCSIRAQLSQLTGAHYKVRYIRHHRFQILLTPHLGHHTLYSHLSQATLHTFCAALATQDSPAREARRSALHTPHLCCAARAALHGWRACPLPHGSLAGLRAACLLPACCLRLSLARPGRITPAAPASTPVKVPAEPAPSRCRAAAPRAAAASSSSSSSSGGRAVACRSHRGFTSSWWRAWRRSPPWPWRQAGA